MAIRLNPFTGKLDFSPNASLQISEEGELPNGNEIAEIQNGTLINVDQIDAGDFNPEP
jgi:hypothetical protein